MSNKLYNLARMSTATVGTGTITLASAVSGYLTFALAGIANGDVIAYGINDGANSEIGTGTYTSAGTTLTRTVTKSTNSNTAISLSGTAQVFITPRAEDLAYYNNATLQANPANPTGSTSATGVMMGLGGTCTITPVYTGRVKVEFLGWLKNSAVATSTHKVFFGTGTAPINGAAITGTQIGNSVGLDEPASANQLQMANGGIITGLTPGTAYWFDLSLAASSGTATFGALSCNAFEF